MADWQPGDLALCIKQGAWAHFASGELAAPSCVRGGGVYQVRRVGISPFSGACVLWFTEHPGDGITESFNASRFRKITPGTEPEGIEEPRRVPVKEVQHG